MQKLIDEIKIDWKSLFKSFVSTNEPAKQDEDEIQKSNLSIEDKKALKKSLMENDNFGKELFNYGVQEQEEKKKSKKKRSSTSINNEKLNFERNNNEKIHDDDMEQSR